METLHDKIQRVVQEHVAIVPYDPRWPALFMEEKQHLLACLPPTLLKRIEHFGSTAVPGLPAKSIIDMLIEVTDLDATQQQIVPILEAQGYDYFWRPAWDDARPPFYAWFIKRDAQGTRTHHLHMVEAHFEHWDRLLFRDYLIAHPAVAAQYATLKMDLAHKYPNDRVGYTKAKTEFIVEVTAAAKRSHPRPDP